MLFYTNWKILPIFQKLTDFSKIWLTEFSKIYWFFKNLPIFQNFTDFSKFYRFFINLTILQKFNNWQLNDL